MSEGASISLLLAWLLDRKRSGLQRQYAPGIEI